MGIDYWQKQTTGKALFPDIEWSRPEHQKGAGKLLIIGGNAHGLTTPAIVYQAAKDAGVGSLRVILPDILKRKVGKSIDNCYFAPSTPSGSFASRALAEFLEHSAWSDGVILAGDFGRNAETSVLIEAFTAKYNGLLTLSGDSVEHFTVASGIIADRPNTLLVLNIGWLQRWGKAVGVKKPILKLASLLQMVEAMHELTMANPTIILTWSNDNLLLSYKGEVISTPVTGGEERLISAAARASVYWLQQPTKAMQAISTSLIKMI